MKISNILSLLAILLLGTGCSMNLNVEPEKNIKGEICYDGVNPETKECFFDDREYETYYFGYPIGEG